MLKLKCGKIKFQQLFNMESSSLISPVSLDGQEQDNSDVEIIEEGPLLEDSQHSQL
jgi:hypothetical protein